MQQTPLLLAFEPFSSNAYQTTNEKKKLPKRKTPNGEGTTKKKGAPALTYPRVHFNCRIPLVYCSPEDTEALRVVRKKACIHSMVFIDQVACEAWIDPPFIGSLAVTINNIQ